MKKIIFAVMLITSGFSIGPGAANAFSALNNVPSGYVPVSSGRSVSAISFRHGVTDDLMSAKAVLDGRASIKHLGGGYFQVDCFLFKSRATASYITAVRLSVKTTDRHNHISIGRLSNKESSIMFNEKENPGYPVVVAQSYIENGKLFCEGAADRANSTDSRDQVEFAQEMNIR